MCMHVQVWVNVPMGISVDQAFKRSVNGSEILCSLLANWWHHITPTPCFLSLTPSSRNCYAVFYTNLGRGETQLRNGKSHQLNKSLPLYFSILSFASSILHPSSQYKMYMYTNTHTWKYTTPDNVFSCAWITSNCTTWHCAIVQLVFWWETPAPPTN